MNTKREKFCIEYAASGNATQSAIAAGYSTKTARSQGQRLLTFVDVQERIKELSRGMGKEITDVETVRKFWSTVLKDTSVKPSDRLKASELLAKSYGMFICPEASGSVSEAKEAGDIVIYLPDDKRNGE